MKRLVTEVGGGEEIDDWLWEPCEHWKLAGQSYHHREMARASGQIAPPTELNPESTEPDNPRDAANREQSLNCGVRQRGKRMDQGKAMANQKQPMHVSLSIRWNVPEAELFVIHSYSFVYFRLCWIFAGAPELFLVVASGSYSSLGCTGFSCGEHRLERAGFQKAVGSRAWAQ